MVIELADKLVDRVIQLLNCRKQMRVELLNNHVSPIFEEFEKVHNAYLESFSLYRNMIQSSQERNWVPSLQAKLERDNLFSANCRSKVVRLAEAEDEDAVGLFVKGICEYLLGARLVESLGKKIQPLRGQRWRQSLFRTLGEIENENWQMVIDPDGARPPLSPEEIPDELDQTIARYAGSIGSFTKQEQTKRACALRALDGIVGEMQDQYDQVCQEYVKLKYSLSK